MWVNALGIITGMANKMLFGNRTMMQFIREAMGNIQKTLDRKASIALARIIWSSPFPTFFCCCGLNIMPKGNDWILETRTRLAMSRNKGGWFPLDSSAMVTSHLCQWCWLTTTTLTKAIGNIVRDIIGLHKNLHFLCHVPGRLQRRWDNFIGLLQSILPHLNEWDNNPETFCCLHGLKL